MKSQHKTIALLVYAVAALSWVTPLPVHGQTAPKAMVLAWDGAVPLFVRELLAQGKLPNLAKLIQNGAFADEVTPGFPSLTAPGFASLWTGAPPRVTGVSGNRVPRLPRHRHSILESSLGFNSALLRAQTLWVAAQHAGRKIVVVHVPFGGEKSAHGVHFQGYAGIAGRDGVVNGRTSRPQPATSWKNLPGTVAPPLEVAFAIGTSTFFGLLIDDPSDPQSGYDTLLVAGSRDGSDVRARLKGIPPGRGGDLPWSKPVKISTHAGHNATTYLRLFELKADGSDFFLYYTRPTREIVSHAELLEGANPTIRAFIGNGAGLLYTQGAFGAAIPDGGDGTAEARYLDTIAFTQHQLMVTTQWAMQNLQWDLFSAYTAYPDESEHQWRGYLDPGLPGFRPEIADRLQPFLERVYQSCDELLGMFMSSRPENSIVALVSDHGFEGVYKNFAINAALRRAGLLVTDSSDRVDLAKTKAIYPSTNSGYLLLNTTDRKAGIVRPEERAELVAKIRQVLSELRDGDKQIVTSIIDAAEQGDSLGIGGESGGDLYVELLPGYDFDVRINAAALITERKPHGWHGFPPSRSTMRTLMVLNGPGVANGRKLADVRLIDFAPTLSKLLGIPAPKDATGRVLQEALSGR